MTGLEERALVEELERRRKDEPLRYVKLNPCCERYARSWIKKGIRTVLFIAPNAVGKTYSTVTLTGWTMWPELAPAWFKERVVRKLWDWPHSIRICSTAEEVGDTGSVQKAIEALWPRKKYAAEKKRKPFNSFFKSDTGWTVDIMTYDQEKKEFEGGDRGLLIFNEPPPEDIYQACIARTRMGGMMVFPGTPLYDAAWIKDKLVDKYPADQTIEVIGGDIEEACLEHSANGHLKHDEIERLKASYDPEVYEARVKGKFMHLSGLIYRNFDQTFVHKAKIEKSPMGTAFQVIDPAGFNKPFAVIWGQVVTNPMHGIRILREWPDGSKGASNFFENLKEPGMKIEDYAKLFREVERELGFDKDSVHRILDKRFGHNRDVTTGLSLREQFDSFGYFFNDSYSVPEKDPEMRTGITAVRNYLKKDPISGIPYLILDPSCVNTRRAFERWSLDANTQKPKDDVWKNFMDVVRYACAANLQYETTSRDWEYAGGPVWGGI